MDVAEILAALNKITYKEKLFMFKRRLIFSLIGFCRQQHLTVFIGLLMGIVSYQNVYSQQQIALDTHAIFQQSCLICHGPDGAYKETLLMEHNALIEKGSVVPENPDASELYKRLITTETQPGEYDLIRVITFRTV